MKPNALGLKCHTFEGTYEVGFHYVLGCIWQPLRLEVCLKHPHLPLNAVQPNLQEHRIPKLTPMGRFQTAPTGPGGIASGAEAILITDN
ncbi:MAG: hypothetical protein OYL97_05915 [Candidatus Poribacteria bacterium]|nr:hypothetical protein [Candidatus Poribacteria bacterium]